MDDIERALLIKNEVFVYKIPPRASAKGYRAADWKLDAPDWTGRLRCIEKGAVFKKNIYLIYLSSSLMYKVTHRKVALVIF
jgi:hypothetical protein